MPLGFIITEWTEDQGLIVKLNYPENLDIDLDDMMRIFYAHITGAGEAGNVLVRLAKIRSNVSSYFTGMDTSKPIMINLMLELGEEPETFGEAIIHEINEAILVYLKYMEKDASQSYEIEKELKKYLKKSMFLLERLKNLTKEQRLAQIYSNKKGRTILKILQDRAISRKELQTYLEIELNRVISNIEISLDPFVKTGLIKQDWIEDDSDISLFLLSDFAFYRGPAIKIIQDAEKQVPTPQLATKYLSEVSTFFEPYKPNLEDNLIAARNMIDPDKYDYIVLFRERAYPINKLPRGPGEAIEETRTFLKSMEDDQIIKVIEDEKGAPWIFLLTDIVAQPFYPEYLIEKIREYRMSGKLDKHLAIKHLELLEEVYKKA
ncbi:MAG: hypothetical protein ACXAEX_19880 [Promethearchaeota archaeon]|jgi:hypothetical protein